MHAFARDETAYQLSVHRGIVSDVGLAFAVAVVSVVADKQRLAGVGFADTKDVVAVAKTFQGRAAMVVKLERRKNVTIITDNWLDK